MRCRSIVSRVADSRPGGAVFSPVPHARVRGGNGDPAFLLFQTDADIRALFMGIDDLCRKYSKETFQVSPARGTSCSA